MAEISKIALPSGTVYDIKDEVARQAASAGVSFVRCTDAGSTPKDVEWDDDGTTITGTLVASASTTGAFYLVPATTQGGKDIFAEYITVTYGSGDDKTYSWEKIGTTDIDLSDLKGLAYKDSATGNYTPEGTVSQPSFTGTEGNVSVSGTPLGSISVGSGTTNYTPAGSVAAPELTVTPSTETVYVAASATGGGSVTAGSAASCTLPSLTTSVSGETLTIGWSAGSFSANTPTAVTLPSFSSQSVATGISSATATAPAFTGTAVDLEFTGSATTSTGKFTPSGSVSQPTFSGTEKAVTVS